MWHSYDNTQQILDNKKTAELCFKRAAGLIIGVLVWFGLAKIFSPSVSLTILLVIWFLCGIGYVGVGLWANSLVRRYEKLDKEKQ